MLTHLHIEHFAIIEDLDCDFDSNMNVILGESGSGKSILMDALSLLTGTKSEFGKIRYGYDKALIEGVFKITNKDNLKYLKSKYEDYIDEDEFVISRSLDLKNKSVSKLNGRVIPLFMMKDLMSSLLDIHSSSKDLFFFDEKNQCSILDSFIKKNSQFTFNEEEIYLRYQHDFNTYTSLLKKKDELETFLNSDIDIDYLNFQIEELEKANIKENEMEDLEEKLISLNHIVDLTNKLEAFKSDYEKATSLLYSSKRNLDSIKDDAFLDLKESFNDAYFSLEDSYKSIIDKYEELLSNSESIDEMKNRLYYLHSLKRKYGSTTALMLEKLTTLKDTLDKYENAEYELKKLNKEIEEFIVNLNSSSQDLNKVREKYALILESSIDNELKDLLFEYAEFKIDFKDKEFDINGNKKISFLIRTNKGMEFLPLKETASLGESSRLSLALKKVFFDDFKKETLIFDEIDIGLSGKAATAVSLKIKEISKLTQVMVISHLFQVAVKGDHFYQVIKSQDEEKASSKMKAITKDEAKYVIAKMVSIDDDLKDSIKMIENYMNE